MDTVTKLTENRPKINSIETYFDLAPRGDNSIQSSKKTFGR